MKKMITGLTLLATLLLISGCGDSSESSGNGSAATNSQVAALNLDDYAKPELNSEQMYTLAYMWHEEKLAYEIYLELNRVHPAQQLEKIATNSEIKHIALVEELVEWYDINITNLADYSINYSQEELAAMPVGVYAIDAIQSLYDTLYAKGIQSPQDALEVGCMVEVTDINDLDEDLRIAEDNQAIIDTFTILRDGSYKHYWAFDKGLKNMGVSDGCCSLGTDYCHPEYPQNEQGSQDHGHGNGNGNGQQRGRNH